MSLKDLTGFLSKNSPTILTCLAAVGAVSTTVLAVKATPRAQDHLYDAEDEKGGCLTPIEKVEACWKDYIPAAISGAATLGCIFGARYCSHKQQEVLASGYILAHTTLKEYERVVSERLGEGKAAEVREEVRTRIADQQAAPANYISDKQQAIYTGHGTSLFYDVPEQQYFYSDIQFLKNSRNELNDRLLAGHEPYIDQNEIRAEWGLPWKKFGTENVITPERLLELNITPELMENGEVRLLLDYELYPKSEVLRR